jgi:hypothetical protein
MGLKKKSLAVCPQSQIMFGFVNHPIFLSSFHITQAQAFFDSKWDIIHVLCIFQPGLLNQWNAFIFKWKWTLEIDFLFLKKKKKKQILFIIAWFFFYLFLNIKRCKTWHLLQCNTTTIGENMELSPNARKDIFYG